MADLANGQLFLSNVTLSGNKAACECCGKNHCDGAGIFSAFAFVEIKNSILANEPGNGNCSINGGDFLSGNHNLSDDATCAFSGPGDMNSVAAGFDSAGLADNGGPTKTMALLPASPAVDAILRPTAPIEMTSHRRPISVVSCGRRARAAISVPTNTLSRRSR